MGYCSPFDGNCPFCKTGFRLTESLGEDQTEEIECRECERTFEVVASIQVTYTARCLAHEHKWKQVKDYPTLDECEVCEKSRGHVE